MVTVDLDLPDGAGKIKKILESNVISITKMVAMEFFRNVAITTPVDTGRLRWGWYITVNAPSNTVPPDGNYGFPDFASHTEGSLNAITINDTLYVSNNVHYAIYVNNGTSKMTGRRFVETALTRTQNSLAAALK